MLWSDSARRNTASTSWQSLVPRGQAVPVPARSSERRFKQRRASIDDSWRLTGSLIPGNTRAVGSRSRSREGGVAMSDDW